MHLSHLVMPWNEINIDSSTGKMDYSIELNYAKVRVCEEQSDELKRRVYWILTYMLDTSICNGAAAKFFAISNVTDAPSIATRFARRSSTSERLRKGESRRRL